MTKAYIYADRYLKEKKEKEAEKSAERKRALDSALAGYFEKNKTRLMDDFSNRLKTYSDSAAKLSGDFSERYFNDKGEYRDEFRGDAGDYLSSFDSSVAELNKSRDSVNSFLDAYGKYLDTNSVVNIRSYLYDTERNIGNMRQMAAGDKDHWGNFADEKEYKDYLTSVENIEKLSDPEYAKGLENRFQKIDRYNSIIEDYNKATRYQRMGDVEDKAALVDKLLSKYKDMRDYIRKTGRVPSPDQGEGSPFRTYDSAIVFDEKVGVGGNVYNRYLQNLAVNSFRDQIQTPVVDNGEFNSLSEKEKRAFLERTGRDQYQTALSWLDSTISDLEEDRDTLINEPKYRNEVNQSKYYQRINEYTSKNDFAENSKAKSGVEYPLDKYFSYDEGSQGRDLWGAELKTDYPEKMNETDRSLYYYIYNTEGKEKANDYLKSIDVILGQRKQQERMEDAENGSLSWLKARGYNLLNLFRLDRIIEDVGGLFGAEVNPYSKAHEYELQAEANDYATQKWAADVSKDWQFDIIPGENEFTIDLSGLLPKTLEIGGSVVDNVARLPMGKFGLPLMALDVYSRSLKEGYERGLSQKQAVSFALASGINEALFEYVSLDKLLKSKNITSARQFFKELLSQAGVEASEEVATSIANNIADKWINGADSKFNTEVRRLMSEENLSAADARIKAGWDQFGDVIMDGVGGFVSGGVMGAGGSAINYSRSVNAYASPYMTEGKIDPEKVKTLQDRAERVTANPKVFSEYLSESELKALSKALKDIETSKKVGKGDVARLAASYETLFRNAAAKSLSSEFKNSQLSEAFSKKQTGEIADLIISGVSVDQIAEQYSAQIGGETEAFKDGVKNAYLKSLVKINDIMKNASAPAAGTDTVSAPSVENEDDVPFYMSEMSEEGETVRSSENAGVSDVDFNADGKTLVKTSRGVSEAEIVDIVSNDDGDMKVKVNVDGETRTVSLSDVSLPNESMAALYSGMQKMGVSPKTAKTLIEQYRGPSGEVSDGDRKLHAVNYMLSARTAYYAGSDGNRKALANATDLTEAQKNIIYNLGQEDALLNDEAKEREKRTEKRPENKNSENKNVDKKQTKKTVTYKDGIDPDDIKWNGKQKAGIAAAEMINRISSLKITVYASHDAGNGRRVYRDEKGVTRDNAPNGFFINGNEIWIDINSGDKGQGAMLYTLSHELSHFIREWSPSKWRKMANYLIENFVEEEGTVEEIILREQSKLREQFKKEKRLIPGDTTLHDLAYEELISDALSPILTEKEAYDKIVKKISEVNAEDPTFGQKIKEFIKGLIDKIKSFLSSYKNEAPETAAGRSTLKLAEDVYDTLVDMYADAFGEAEKNAREAEETERSGEVRKSDRDTAYDFSKSFEEQIDDYRKGVFPANDTLIVRGTPKVFQQIGLLSLPMTYTQKHLREALANENGDHLGETLLKQIPQALEKPIAIIDSTSVPGRLVAIVELSGQARKIIAAIEVDGEGVMQGNTIDSNAIVSIHSRKNAIVKLLADAVKSEGSGKGGIYYWEKNKAIQNTNGRGVQFPKSSAIADGFIRSIHDPLSKVNTKYKNIFETKQFRRWFGKSKTVKTDGTPKVYYHGTPAQFTKFDKSKAKSSGLYGKGFYFTESESHAGTYGNKMAVYLSIENPLIPGESKITRTQIEKFLQAVAENEDYSIENYGTYDVGEIADKIKSRDAFAVIQDINATAIGDFAEAIKLFNEVNDTKFDGIITPTETVVFEPTQIKSATDNIGTFDKTNPDIRYSERGKGNGYDGYSMSNNARDAYASGEMPISKWTKAAFIDAVSEINEDIDVSRLTVETMKQKFLKSAGWHHTSSKYNRTDFYGLDEDYISELTQKDIDGIENVPAERKKVDSSKYRGDIEYIEWTGTRKHPKANKRSLKDVNIEERGSFYIVTDDDGNELIRKKIGSNGTEVKNYEEEARRKKLYEDIRQKERSNSSEAAMELLTAFRENGYERSSSGNLYARGRKPSRLDYESGLENFFKVGEQRLSPNENGGYDVETWNGSKWESEKRDIRFSEREKDTAKDSDDSQKYSYENLIKKNPVKRVRLLADKAPDTRSKIVSVAKQNAAKVGHRNADGSVYVYNDDLKNNIIIGTEGLRHGLRYSKDITTDINSLVALQIGDIVKNSIGINELNPSKENVSNSYILIGIARKGQNNYIIRSVVNRYTNELTSMDVLYAVNTKESAAQPNAPSSAAKAVSSVTDSNVSIADLLEIVKDHFPDILSKDVLKHFGISERPNGDLGKSALYSSRNPYDIFSARALLANAPESSAKNDVEKTRLAEYKAKIAEVREAERQLIHVTQELADLSFGRGKRDMTQINELKQQKKKLLNALDIYNNQLTRLEKGPALDSVYSRERAKLSEKQRAQLKDAVMAERERQNKFLRDTVEKYREARKKAVEGRRMTETKEKIVKVINELDSLILHPTKTSHVPLGLQGIVVDALEMINNEFDIKADQALERANARLAGATSDDDAEMYQRSVARAESMMQRLNNLKVAYDDIKNDPDAQGIHDDVISRKIDEVRKEVGDTPLSKMNAEQLDMVYKMYRAIKASVSNANRLFKEGRAKTVSEGAEKVMSEIRESGKNVESASTFNRIIRDFGFGMLKPQTFFDVMRSETLSEIFRELMDAEGKYARNITNAVEYMHKIESKYKSNEWNLDEKHRFTNSQSATFELTLDQIMSLYAYSKRDKAGQHLAVGGFVTGQPNDPGFLEKIKNDTTAYTANAEDLKMITDVLTADQKAYADEMQKYLSVDMAKLGNDVSLALYEIKLFNEKYYFPIRTSDLYLDFVPETTGGVKQIKNSGFTKAVNPKATNPVVLENFKDVWNRHVNQMSMYNAFTLALEDFTKVYNYETISAPGSPSVRATLEQAFTKSATKYIEKMLLDVNGASQSETSIAQALVGKFKKSAVFANLSVIIQQPTSLPRAFVYIPPKYFATVPDISNSAWEECKKWNDIALMKDMGSFDTGTGRVGIRALEEKEYKGFKNKAKAFFTDSDYRDDVLSKGAEVADRITWTYMWQAAKNMVAHTTALEKGSDAFMKRASEIFTEAMRRTQVYDSTLSRSQIMRSKNAFDTVATAFMAEPTTQVNMAVDAILKGKKGNKGFAVKTAAAIMTSMILNDALKSLVGALRDKDEDETYLEKWLEHFTSDFIADLNPINYLPYLKDIWSMILGYNVERSEYAVISDLKESVESLISAVKKEEGVLDAGFSVGENVLKIVGLPLNNISRDVRAIINTINNPANDYETTRAGIRRAVEKGFYDNVPKALRPKDDPKEKRLYDALVSGDEADIKRIRSEYKSDETYYTAVRKALRDHDSRVWDAAMAHIDGDTKRRVEIVTEIVDEKRFNVNDVIRAVNSEIEQTKKDISEGKADKLIDRGYPKEWVSGKISGVVIPDAEDEKEAEETTLSFYQKSDLNNALEAGDIDTFGKVYRDLTEHGTSKSSIQSSITSYWRTIYREAAGWDGEKFDMKKRNENRMREIRELLYQTGVYADVSKTCQNWLK